MTEQETFEIVSRHLLTQNERSYLEPPSVVCAYRSPEGLKCAVGILIPDEEYDEGLERNSAISYIMQPLLRKLEHDIILCSRLQGIHDTVCVGDWRKALIALGKELELDTAFLDTL